MSTSHAAPAPKWATPVAFFLPLALYLTTAARTIQGGDMGEFGLIGMVGGVPHPPGYPLYALLSRLISFLPIDPPFFRIAITSALCGAGAVAIIQRLAWRLTGNVVASLGASLVFAVSAIQWRLSGVPEVFALHGLLTALTMLCALRVLDATRETLVRESLLMGLALGLASSNHHTTALLAPFLLAVIIASAKRFGMPVMLRSSAAILVGGLVGLAPYTLLVVWGAMDRSKVWAWGDTGSISGLLTHVLRAEYGTFSLAAKKAATTELRLHYIATSIKQFPIQYVYLPFLAGLTGVVVAWRRSRAFALGLAGCLALAAIVFPSLMNLPRTELHAEVTERFFLMPMVLFAPLVACGLHFVQERSKAAVVVALLALAIPLNALLSYSHANWKSDTIVERYLVASITSLPKNAIVLGRTDTLGPGMGWVTRVMKVRPDVRFVNTNLLGLRWYYDDVKAQIPDFPLPYIHAMREIGEIARAASTVAPTYLFPWIVPDAKKMIALEPNGLLYGVARQGDGAISADEFQARMDRDLKVLGDATEPPVDAWSGKIHQAITYPLSDLLEAHKAAGHAKQAEELLTFIGGVLPPESPDDIDIETGDEAVAATH